MNYQETFFLDGGFKYQVMTLSLAIVVRVCVFIVD